MARTLCGTDIIVAGNLAQIAEGQAAEVELDWQARYGDTIKIKALFGEDRLLISDPKALQYIYQTSGYNFPKQPERREISRLTTGRGLLWADGDGHKRQRKIMLPGFSGPEAKHYLPVFSACATKMAEKWRENIVLSGEDSAIIDIPSWASRCALDAIGEIAFDYHFKTLDNGKNELGKAFGRLLLETFGRPSKPEIFVQNFFGYIPMSLREVIGDYMPSKKLNYARYVAKLSVEAAKELFAQKFEGHGHGKDIMSLLVKANSAEDEKRRLNEEEMFDLMRVVILAGHETTANTLSWMLLEMARHPDVQTKLRAEIRAMQRSLESRGELTYTNADIESMPYLNACMKETLRYHPVAINTFRQASRNDVLPLSKPITTATGEVLTELPIPKGLNLITSITSYNRNKEIFGHDADVFNPERWLNSGVKKSTSVGVLGNLSCIGWKFAVTELQVFLFELIGQMEFSRTPESERVRREAAIVMVPTIEGQVEKGAQLPLRVRVTPRDEEEEL
ncbi:hypothetical protein DXG01_010948 [Tephrocybe rancida]|nr:hypothetical protein DXG01_010948 [Tephrocybe rancida]